MYVGIYCSRLGESVNMDWVSFGNLQDDDMICRWVGRPVGAASQCRTLFVEFLILDDFENWWQRYLVDKKKRGIYFRIRYLESGCTR